MKFGWFELRTSKREMCGGFAGKRCQDAEASVKVAKVTKSLDQSSSLLIWGYLLSFVEKDRIRLKNRLKPGIASLSVMTGRSTTTARNHMHNAPTKRNVFRKIESFEPVLD